MKVSIIIPLYNKALFVTKALDSVLAQTFTDYECVIINDGSTDDSVSIVQQWMQNNACSSRFRLINQSNGGVSAARNYGIESSQGEYIAFLDADDWWAPNYLEEMTRLAREYPDAGIIGCAYYYVKNGRQRIDVCPLRENGVPLNVGEKSYINYFRSYAEGAMPLWTGAVLIPRCVLDEVKRDDGYFRPLLQLGEDFDLWCRIVLHYKVVYMNTPLAYYNNDVPITLRAVGSLHDPKCHMLWHLQWLEPYELLNADVKCLMDKLRVYSMKPYFLNRDTHAASLWVLDKVDWTKQSLSQRCYYRMPRPILQAHVSLMQLGSWCKQRVLILLLCCKKTLFKKK
ncbi:MAG: glycosyltransferase family 2 protein [Paludibacteraceae bacterium]